MSASREQTPPPGPSGASPSELLAFERMLAEIAARFAAVGPDEVEAEIAAENAMGYQRWWIDRIFIIAPAGAYVGQWLQSFREFPPRQKPGSFNLDRVTEAVSKPAKN